VAHTTIACSLAGYGWWYSDGDDNVQALIRCVKDEELSAMREHYRSRQRQAADAESASLARGMKSPSLEYAVGIDFRSSGMHVYLVALRT